MGSPRANQHWRIFINSHTAQLTHYDLGGSLGHSLRMFPTMQLFQKLFTVAKTLFSLGHFGFFCCFHWLQRIKLLFSAITCEMSRTFEIFKLVWNMFFVKILFCPHLSGQAETGPAISIAPDEDSLRAATALSRSRYADRQTRFHVTTATW